MPESLLNKIKWTYDILSLTDILGFGYAIVESVDLSLKYLQSIHCGSFQK